MAKRILPWGNAVSKSNAWAKSKVRMRGNAKRNTSGNPSPQLRGMDYPANSPADWPVEPDVTANPPRRGKRGIANTEAKQNTALNAAYTRTYAKPGGLKSTNP